MSYDWEPGYRARYLAQKGVYSSLYSFNVQSKSHFTFHEFQLLIVGIFLSAGINSLLNYKVTCSFLFYLGILHFAFRISRDKIWHYNVLLISTFFSVVTGASLSLDYLIMLSSFIYTLGLTILGVIGMSPFDNITNSPFIIYLITYNNMVSVIIGMLCCISFYFGMEEFYYLVGANASVVLGLLIHKIAVLECKSPFAENKNGQEKQLKVSGSGRRRRAASGLVKFAFFIILRVVTLLMVLAGVVTNLIVFSNNSERFGMTQQVVSKEYIITYYLLITHLILTSFATLAVILEFLNFFINWRVLTVNFVNSYRLTGAVVDSSYSLVLERSMETKRDEFIDETIDGVIERYKVVKVIYKRRVKHHDLDEGEECYGPIRYYNLTCWCHLFDKWANELDFKVVDQSKRLAAIKRFVANQIGHIKIPVQNVVDRATHEEAVLEEAILEEAILEEAPSLIVKEKAVDKEFHAYRSKSLQQAAAKGGNIPRFQSIPHPLQLPLLECIIPKIDKCIPKGIIERSREVWEKERGRFDDICAFNYEFPPVAISKFDSFAPDIFVKKCDNIETDANMAETESYGSLSASQAWDSFINKIDNNSNDEDAETETGNLDSEFGRISLPEQYSNLSQHEFDDEIIISDMYNRLAERDIANELLLSPVSYKPFDMVKGEPMNVSREEFLKNDVPIKIDLVRMDVLSPRSPRLHNPPRMQHNYDSNNLYNSSHARNRMGNTSYGANGSCARANSYAAATGWDAGGTGELAVSGESGAVPEGHEFEPVDTTSQDTVEDMDTGPVESSIPDELSLDSSQFSKISCNADFSDLDETPVDDSQSSYTNQSYSPNYYLTSNYMARTARFGKDSDSVTRASSIEQVFL